MDEQNISGDENVQARSEGDMTAAIGDEAIAAVGDVLKAGRDIVINQYIQTSSSETSETDEISDDNDIIDQTAQEDASNQGEFDERRSQTPNNEFDFVTSTEYEPYKPENFTTKIDCDKTYLSEKQSDRLIAIGFFFLLSFLGLSFGVLRLEDIISTDSIHEFTSINDFFQRSESYIGVRILFLFMMLGGAILTTNHCRSELYKAHMIFSATKIPITREDIGKKHELVVMAWTLFFALTFGIGIEVLVPFILIFTILSFIILSNLNELGLLNLSNISGMAVLYLLNWGVLSALLGFFWVVGSWQMVVIFLPIGLICLSLYGIIQKIELNFADKGDIIFSRRNALLMHEILTNKNWRKRLPNLKASRVLRTYVFFVRYGLVDGIGIGQLKKVKNKNLTFKEMLLELESLFAHPTNSAKNGFDFLGFVLSLFSSWFFFPNADLKIYPHSDECKSYLRDLILDIGEHESIEFLNSSVFSFSEINNAILNPNYTWQKDGVILWGTSHALLELFDLRRNHSDQSNGKALYYDVKGLDEFIEHL